MTTVQLMGGLGNQLFQIAAAKAHSILTNDEFGIDYRFSYVPNQGKTAINYKNSIFNAINEINVEDYSFNFYEEKTFHHEPIESKKNLFLKGYFQSEKYFFSHKEKIKNLFAPNKDILAKIENFKSELNINKETTSIHIRRGDYLRLSHHHYVCTIDYYRKAVEKIKTDKYLVFSDDQEWAFNNFKEDKFIIINSNDEIFDFYLMSNCNHNIISNSTFSWWASYLNKNLNKKIIAPQKWFAENVNLNTADIYSPNWEII